MKKTLAIILSIIMVFSLIPMTAYAAEEAEEVTSGEEYISSNLSESKPSYFLYNNLLYRFQVKNLKWVRGTTPLSWRLRINSDAMFFLETKSLNSSAAWGSYRLFPNSGQQYDNSTQNSKMFYLSHLPTTVNESKEMYLATEISTMTVDVSKPVATVTYLGALSGEPTWDWNDRKTSAYVIFTMMDGSTAVEIEFRGTLANGTPIPGENCQTMGQDVKTASVTVNGNTYTDSVYTANTIPGPHSYAGATCTSPRVCTLCGAEEGAPLGHDWSGNNGICKNDNTHLCDHAGYESAALCGTCGKTLHEHSWEYSAADNVITATCTAENCPVTGEQTITITADNATYNGKAIEATVEGSIDGVTPEITYEATEGALTDGKPMNVGTYTASITLGEATASVTYTIGQLDAGVATVTVNEACTYTGSAIIPEVSIEFGDYTFTADKDYTVSATDNIDAGTATVIVTFKGNYSGTATGEFTIAKATPGVTAPTANELTYNTSAQALVTAGITTGGEMQYSLNGESWSAAIPTGTDAGEYTVYYKIVGGTNYEDAEPSTVTVTIAPKVVNNPVIEGIDEQYLYQDGNEIEPVPTAVKDGNTIISADEYTVEYDNNTETGTATVKIVDKDGGNYTVNGSTHFYIVKHAHDWVYTAEGNIIFATCVGTIGTCPDTDGGTVTISAENGTYTGQALENAQLDYSDNWVGPTDLTITYENNTEIGEATATVTIGEATATINFDIIADYSEADAVLAEVDTALGTDTFTTEAEALYNDYAAALESYKADKTTAQADVDALAASLTELKADIEKGTAILPDFSAIDRAYVSIVIPEGEELTDEAAADKAAIDALYAICKEAENQAELDENESALLSDITAFVADIENDEAFKADYTALDEAFALLVAPEGEELTDSAVEFKATVKATIDALKAEDTSKTELDAADDAILADIASLYGSIGDGTALKSDYSAYDEAMDAIAGYLADETLIKEFKEELEIGIKDLVDSDYADENGELIRTLNAAQQSIIDAVTSDVKAVIEGIEKLIESGEIVKADFTGIDAAVASLVAPEGEEFTDEALAEIAEIKAEIDYLKNIDIPQSYLDENEEGFYAYIEQVKGLIANGILTKADTTVADELIAQIDAVIAEGKFDDEEALAKLEELRAEIEAIKADGNASKAEYQQRVDELTAELEEVYECCQECEICGKIHTTFLHEIFCLLQMLLNLIASFSNTVLLA